MKLIFNFLNFKTLAFLRFQICNEKSNSTLLLFAKGYIRGVLIASRNTDLTVFNYYKK